MYIHGSFTNQKGDACAVHILTNGDRTSELVIGEEETGVFFSDDPVQISDESNDTFDAMLRHSASIRLLCRDMVSDFYCDNCRDAVVNVFVNDACVFAGFLEPLTYSQSYNEYLDEVELSCIDVLSALQYSKYKNVGASGVDYETVKASARQRTFLDIMKEIAVPILKDIDITGNHSVSVLFDGSKAVDDTEANRYNIFTKIAIADLLFFGDKEDDVWQQDEIIEEIMRYLNLHIVQCGFTFYIFSWETVKTLDAITWHDITTDAATTTQRASTDITNANVADTATTIDMCEAFNQLLLTDDITKTESIIDSPLDDSYLTSPFRNKQKVMTEYSSEGEGKKAFRAIYAMAHGEKTDYANSTVTDWFMQAKQSSRWTFASDPYVKAATHQEAVLAYLGSNIAAALVAWGKVVINNAKDDNSLVSTVDMTDYLMVSVNGNYLPTKASETNDPRPNEDDIKKVIPVASYTGNSAGGVFSPADSETINYIVISGSVILNPLMQTSGWYAPTDKTLVPATFEQMRKSTEWWPAYVAPIIQGDLQQGKVYYDTVPCRNNPDGRYYLRKWWTAERPQDEAEYNITGDSSAYPFTDDGPEEYEFKYSAIGDGEDKISKVSVLQCMLVIGDKCVVEKTPTNDLGTGVPYTGEGLPDDFVWVKYKELSECADEDEYYAQSFSIGFNPKIGDKLVGKEYDIQNNHSYQLNVDEDGIAIPIHNSDKVSGVVQFKILGPVNLTWDEITRRHGSFWRHTKWGSKSVPLMAHVSSVMIKQFEIKVYSDDGLMSGTGGTDNDLVYMSDTSEEFVNRKDDLTFKFTTQLTSAEAKALGVSNEIKMSAPLDVDTELGLLTIYDRNKQESGKPEQIYVDSYYNEWHAPRILLTQTLDDEGAAITPFDHFRHPALDKDFYIQGIALNLMEGTATVKMKEVW